MGQPGEQVPVGRFESGECPHDVGRVEARKYMVLVIVDADEITRVDMPVGKCRADNERKQNQVKGVSFLHSGLQC
jgi:hypothetical protein